MKWFPAVVEAIKVITEKRLNAHRQIRL